jgi:streptogramin lyase
MPLQSSGKISLSDIQNEFGGEPPISLSEYYGFNSTLPSSGRLALGNTFYGKSIYVDLPGDIKLYAGSSWGYNGTDIPAVESQIGEAQRDLHFKDGYIYLCADNMIRRINLSTGIISNVAGSPGYTGAGYSGDGSLAINAKFQNPYGVCVDNSGNIYIADAGNQRIRRIGTNGIITTIAGNGTAGITGNNGLGTSATVQNPRICRFEASTNNLYWVDNNYTIRRLNLDTNIITTLFTGNTLYINGMTIVGSTIFLATANGAIYWVSTSGGSANLYAGSASQTGYTEGSFSNARFRQLYGIDSDSNGNLYVSDINNFVVRKISPSTGTVSRFAGTAGTRGYSGDGGQATSALINNPFSLCVDSNGNVYFNSFAGYDFKIRRVDTSGVITHFAGTGILNKLGPGETALRAQFYAHALAVDSSGNLYIRDSQNARILKINDADSTVSLFAGNGQTNTTGDGGQAVNASFWGSAGIAFDSSNNMYVGDAFRMRRIDTNGIITTIATLTGTPTAFHFQPNTTFLYFAQNDGQGGHTVRRMNISNASVQIIAGDTSIFGGGYNGDNRSAVGAQVRNVGGIATDSSGNIYIADTLNNRIRKITSGTITTIAGNGTPGYNGDNILAVNAQLNYPSDVKVDASNNVYILDDYNYRIRKIDTNGIITTFAGTGTNPFTAGMNNGVATSANVSGNVMIFDPSYNLYFAQFFHFVRRLNGPVPYPF